MKKKLSWTSLIAAASGDVRRASSVTRYSSIPVCQFENLMEHTGYVAVFSAMIARKIGAGPSVVGAAVMKAVTHDLDECVTGDVVRTFKYSDKALKDAIDRVGAKLASKMEPDTRDLFAATDEMMTSCKRPQLVKDVVKAADFMSLYQYMRREAARHNFEIIPYYGRMLDDLGSMAAADPSGLGSLYAETAAEAVQVAGECFGRSFESPVWRKTGA